VCLLFQHLNPLPQTRNARLEFVLFDEAIGIAVNQARQPTPQLPQLGLNIIALGTVRLLQPPLIFGRQSCRVRQEIADLLPDGGFEQVGPYLRVRADPLAPKSVGVGANTSIVRIVPHPSFGRFGADGLPIIRVLTLGAHHQTL
jgi:hypothetical protein